MNCIDCPYLGVEEVKHLGSFYVCNADVLDDGKGHLMLSVYAKHDWCPLKNEDTRK